MLQDQEAYAAEVHAYPYWLCFFLETCVTIVHSVLSINATLCVLFAEGENFYCHQTGWGAKGKGMILPHIFYWKFIEDNLRLNSLTFWLLYLHFVYLLPCGKTSVRRKYVVCDQSYLHYMKCNEHNRNMLSVCSIFMHILMNFLLMLDIGNHVPVWKKRLQARRNQDCGPFKGLRQKALLWS